MTDEDAEPLRGDVEVDIHTNTIEGAFGGVTTGMRGACEKVSQHYLRSHPYQYSWRYNARHGEGSMFFQLLSRAVDS